MIHTESVGVPTTRIGHVLDDHGDLRRETAELLVLAEHGRDLDRPLRQALFERLGRLRERLRLHFGLESEGGFLAEVVSGRPGLQVRVRRLEREHEVIMQESAAVLELLVSSPPPRSTLGRLVRLVEALHAHEHAENDLIHEALTVDLGGGG
jgi:hypothetical protein